MDGKTIKYELKLQKSVIIILAFIAFGLCGNIFLQAVKSKNAWAMDQVYVYGVKGAPLYVKEVK